MIWGIVVSGRAEDGSTVGAVVVGWGHGGTAGDTAMAAIEIVIVGLVATTIMDLYQQIIRSISGLARTNLALVGRWVALMPHGRFLHDPITETPAVNGEIGIGWLFHYFIGIVLAGIYLVIVYGPMASEPSLGSGLIFGLATLVFPWLIMQPSLGLGICALKAPNGNTIRVQDFTSHLVFGAGLYAGAELSRSLLVLQ